MIGGTLSTFILLSALFVTESMETPSKISLMRVELGDDVTLICSALGADKKRLNWFKYEFENVIKTVANISYDKVQINRQFDPSRFRIIPEADGFSLNIRNVSKDDEATYLCQAGLSLRMRFVSISHLVVTDPKDQKLIRVQPSSDVESVFTGNTLNRKCLSQSKKERRKEIRKNQNQCLGEQRVYWYRAESEPRADIIHATSASCDNHERRCVYNLSKTVQNFSDDGASSCAILSCGQILFEEETKVQMDPEQQAFHNLIILGTLLVSSVLVNTSLFCIKGKSCEHSKAPWHLKQGRSGDESNNLDDKEAELYYAALEFPPQTSLRKTISSQT